MVNSIEITGDQYTRPDEEMISTKSSASKLTAVVTEVSEQ